MACGQRSNDDIRYSLCSVDSENVCGLDDGAVWPNGGFPNKIYELIGIMKKKRREKYFIRLSSIAFFMFMIIIIIIMIMMCAHHIKCREERFTESNASFMLSVRHLLS